MFTFADLQEEVKRRGTRNQSGTQFDTATKNLINTSLFRVAREAPWRSLRRKSFFNTVTSYSTGTGSAVFTANSTTVTVPAATFITNGIRVGRGIKLGSGFFTIRTITSETVLTVDRVYDGTTTSTGSYSVMPQEEYNIPVEAGTRMFMWHTQYGYPLQLEYLTDQSSLGYGLQSNFTAIPLAYRMWGEDMVINPIRDASVITIISSVSTDTAIAVTVFGTVAGFPDYEIITTNGTDATTPISGLKLFSSVDRIVKAATTTGRIIATSNGGNTQNTDNVLAVLPVGDTTAGILYKKVQLFPLPNTVFPVNIQYYKDPYRLVNDGDVHELGQEFDEAIILLATSKVKAEQNQDEGDKFYSLYQEEIRNLRKTNVDKIDYFAKLRRAGDTRSSFFYGGLSYNQVGPFYGPRVF